MTVAEFEARFHELSQYVPDLVRNEVDQATYFEGALWTEIQKFMSVSGKDTFDEVVQSTLRSEKLIVDDRKARDYFFRKRKPGFSTGQSLKRERGTGSSGSGTSSPGGDFS